jgi:peptidoglycan/LPS O-acetylase OafA/YrhL
MVVPSVARKDGGETVADDVGGGAEGRVVSIDILRGLAIIWVVLFHLWGDLEFFPGAPRGYYEALGERIGEGEAWASFTAFTDLVFRLGFQGVPLFMMISGLSLTLGAYRARRPSVAWWRRFFVARFRKLLVPYWAGVALTWGVICVIAWRQAALHDTSFSTEFAHGVTISKHVVLEFDGGTIFASFALLPRLLNEEWFFAPQLALWFVGLLAQYYLLFPLLFWAMRRIGVPVFLLLTFAITVGANAWVVYEHRVLELEFHLVTGWAPFRLFEFTVGMALGWLLVSPEARRTLELLRHPAAIVVALALGLVAHTAGDLMVGGWTAQQLISGNVWPYWQAFALPLVTLGLALLVLPLLVRRPSVGVASLPVRALTTIGVMSYAILIVNDAIRLVASQLRVEDVPSAVWWTFLVCVYMPASVLLAWPLAYVLGLFPSRRRPLARGEDHAGELPAIPDASPDPAFVGARVAVTTADG